MNTEQRLEELTATGDAITALLERRSELIGELHREGVSLRRIAAAAGVSYQTIHREVRDAALAPGRSTSKVAPR